MVTEDRVKSGIKGLDALIEGGFPRNSITLISGPPGTGKSLLCLQYLYYGAMHGEPGMYVTSEQSKEDLISNAKKIGLNLKPLVEKEKLVIWQENLSATEQAMVNEDNLVDAVKDEVNRIKAKRLVADSLSSLINIFTLGHVGKDADSSTVQIGNTKLIPLVIDEQPIVRSIVWDIINGLRTTGCTCLVTSELLQGQSGFSRDSISEFETDGVLMLEAEAVGEELHRSVRLVKMRSTAMRGGRYGLEISGKGLIVK